MHQNSTICVSSQTSVTGKPLTHTQTTSGRTHGGNFPHHQNLSFLLSPLPRTSPWTSPPPPPMADSVWAGSPSTGAQQLNGAISLAPNALSLLPPHCHSPSVSPFFFQHSHSLSTVTLYSYMRQSRRPTQPMPVTHHHALCFHLFPCQHHPCTSSSTAFSYLYNSLPCSASILPYSATTNIYICRFRTGEPDLLAFYFDLSISFPLQAQDVPLVKDWYLEHCPLFPAAEGYQILPDDAGLQVCQQGYNMLNLLIHWKVCLPHVLSEIR
jgi:hypothetical protein